MQKKTNNTLTIHLIPNAHIDPAWLWDWREGLNEGLATCTAMADLMENNPDVTFVRNEAVIYRHIETHDPGLFKRIKILIKKGQWEIVGGTMLQPDTNLGSGETYVRQFLYGQQYFKSRFNIIPEIVYQVDSFGHAAGLPAIYRGAGCRYALQCRPSQKEMPTPSRFFRWVSPDGSEILAANLEAYGLEYEATDKNFTFSARLARECAEAAGQHRHWPMLIGFGNHGGGLNRSLLEEIRHAIQNPPDNCEIVFSGLKKFFSLLEKERKNLPCVHGELVHSFRGCYSSAAGVKRAYREAEHMVHTAERIAVTAAMCGGFPYPHDQIRGVWDDVLFNQFHDILPGSSIERVCQEALDHLGKARHNVREITNSAALSIFSKINTFARQGLPVLLFNPNGSVYDGLAETEWTAEYRPLCYLAPDGSGRTITHVNAVNSEGCGGYAQLLQTDSELPCEWILRTCFQASVPACGYSVYWLDRLAPPVPVPAGIRAGSEGEMCVTNDQVRLEYIKGENGIRIAYTNNKHAPSAAQLFSGPVGAGIILEDFADSWGSGITSWMKTSGSFIPEQVRVLETGPLRASICIISTFSRSRMFQEYFIHAGSEKVFCNVRLEWNEPHSMLKLGFPLSEELSQFSFSSPYAVVHRSAESGEVPVTAWCAACAESGEGIGLATSGQYGMDITGHSMRLTAVRSPRYGAMGSSLDPQGTSLRRPAMDIGLHTFRFVLSPARDIRRTSDELLMPLHITPGYPHRGTRPASQSFVSVPQENITLAAFNKSYSGNGYTLRIWENQGKKTQTEVHILGQKISLGIIKPWQLLTFHLRRNKTLWSAEKTDMC